MAAAGWASRAGQDPSKGTAKGTVKQPYFIHRADGRPLAFAGLYELWRDKSVPEDDADAWLWTATVITTSAPDELGRIHDRMPMIIDADSWADWLDPDATDPAQLRSLLAPAVASGLESYPVSTAVNSVRHNGPELIEPVAAGEAGGHRQLAGPPAGRVARPARIRPAQ